MLLCTISVFAANATDIYTGKMAISVNNKDAVIKDPQNVMVKEGDVVIFTIPDFSFSGTTASGDVVITASNNNGVLTLKSIRYGILPIFSAKFTNSTLKDGVCHIDLSISAGDKVKVVFDGNLKK